MAKKFFVTGTDTGVGKTYVSAAILTAAARRGLRTIAMKPVAAGCDETQDGRRNEDALLLQQSMTEKVSYEQINPVALMEPLAPHIAAKRQGVVLSMQRLAGFCRGLMLHRADLCLIEGAGGWRVPLNDRENLSDLARELELPVIMVVDLRLGCLNHAILTAEAIRHDGLKLAGWVANQSQPEIMAEVDENIATLQRRLLCPMLGRLPYCGDLEVAASCIELDDLLGP